MAGNLLFWLKKTSDYDYFAEDFSETRKRPWPEFDLFKDFITPPFFKGVGGFKNNKKITLVDIGCGNGRLLSYLNDQDSEEHSAVTDTLQNKGACPLAEKNSLKYIGVDLSKGLLACAKKNHPEATFVQADMRKIPLEPFSADVVTMIASLHHLGSRAAQIKALLEAMRLLQPGGKLITTVWNLWQDRFEEARSEANKRAQKLFWWNERELLIPFGKEKKNRMYYAFTEEELKNILEECGFGKVEFLHTQSTESDNMDCHPNDISQPNKGPCPIESNQKNEASQSHPQAKNFVVIAEKPKRVNILDVPFDSITFDDALNNLPPDKGGLRGVQIITTPNPEICVAAQQDPEYLKILQSADLSVPDGWGILWAADYLHSFSESENSNSRLRKTIRVMISLLKFFFSRKSRFLPQRVTGSDLFRQYCSASKKRIFLLGGAPGVAEKAAEYFRKKGANIVGTDDGSSEKHDDERILKKIKDSKAEILFVAFGAPAQEKWIYRNREVLSDLNFAMGIGGSFDFIAGTQKRAPYILRKLGLEWLWRLIKEPKRFQRIITAVWRFPIIVSQYKKNKSKK